MKIFAIGDLHLSFSVENKEMDKFGELWENHYIRLAENWRRLVSPEDLVVVPGDISWAMTFAEAQKDLLWVSELPGKKLFVRGNHDFWWTSLKKMQSMPENISVLQNSAYVAAQGLVIAGTRGWLCPDDPAFSESDTPIYKRELLRLRMSLDDAKEKGGEGAKIICAMHFPPSTYADAKSGFVDVLREYGVCDVIYGHLHGLSWQNRGPQGQISGINYQLVSFDKLGGVPQLLRNLD